MGSHPGSSRLPQPHLLRDLTGGQVAFVADTARKGEPPRPEIGASTDEFDGDRILPAMRLDPTVPEKLFRGPAEVGPLDVVVRGDRRVVKAIPLLSASGEAVGAVVVSRSRLEETAAFRKIRETLLLVGLGVLLVSVPVSVLLGGRIARPLQQLAREIGLPPVDLPLHLPAP